MDYELLKDLIGQKISVKLKSGTYLNGTCTEVIDTGDKMIWIHMLDKFGKLAVFLNSEIIEIMVK